jgi:CheY-like chemotaxis protein
MMGREKESGTRPRALVALVVDDEDDHRELTTLLLRQVGFHVRGAANGQVALEMLASEPRPDVVILDLVMPVVDGWHVLETRSRAPSLSCIPVIVLSATIDGRVRGLGAQALLTKPAHPEALLEALDACVGAGRPNDVPATVESA